MATVIEPLETFADLLDQLGHVPPERIIIKPPVGSATEADVLAYAEAPRKRLCELIDGVLVENEERNMEAKHDTH